MNEVDGILIPILRETGASIPNDVENFEDFDNKILFSSIAAVLKTVSPKYNNLPQSLPESKAERFRLCSRVSFAIQNMGYTSEVGYQTLLYPNELDTRKLLTWMVNQLKSDEDEAETEVSGSKLLQRQIKENLKQWKNARYSLFKEPQPWEMFRVVNVNIPEPNPIESMLDYYNHFLPAVKSQLNFPGSLLPTIIEQNCTEIASQQARDEALGTEEEEKDHIVQKEFFKELIVSTVKTSVAHAKVKKNQIKVSQLVQPKAASVQLKPSFVEERNVFTRRAEFDQEKAVTMAEVVDDSGNIKQITETGDIVQAEEELEEQRAAELAKATRRREKLTRKLDHIQAEVEKQKKLANEREEKLKSAEEKEKKMTQEFKSKQKALSLLPNAQENLVKLQHVVANTRAKQNKLHKEWEKMKAGLTQKVQSQSTQISARKADAKMKVQQLKANRKKMKEMGLEIREKQVQHNELLVALNKLPKSVNRQHYVKRIMDIGKTLDKQKREIRTILRDVNQLQKETNKMAETSQRVFGITDDMVYKAAQNNKDKAAIKDIKNIYRSIVAMRDKFDTLVETIRKKGFNSAEIGDTETRIEQLESSNTGLNLTQVLEDLAVVKAENKELASRIKAQG